MKTYISFLNDKIKQLSSIGEKLWMMLDYLRKLFQFYFDEAISAVVQVGATFGAIHIQTAAQLLAFFTDLNWKKKSSWPLNSIKLFVGIVILTTFSIAVLTAAIIVGTLATIFGFRNLAQYSAKEQLLAWLPLLLLILIIPHFSSEYALYRFSLLAALSVSLLGVDFLFGQCGIVSLGQAGFLTTSGFICVWLINGSFGFQIPVLIAVLIGALLNGLIGLALGLPALRVKDDYLVIISLCLTLATPFILQSKYFGNFSGLAEGGIALRKIIPPTFFSNMPPHVFRYFLVVFPSLILIYIAYNLIHHSQIGRALRTIKCDREISTIIGVPAVKYKLLAFILSAIYAGFGGGLMVVLTQFISKDTYTITTSINFLIANVIGGPGGILGSMFGAAFLVFIPDITDYASEHLTRGAYLAQSLYGVALIITVFFIPRGIANEIVNWLKQKFLTTIPRGSFQMAPPPDYELPPERKSYFSDKDEGGPSI